MRSASPSAGALGATCAGPADPLRIAPLVGELSGGRPFVIREDVRWCGGNTALEEEIDAASRARGAAEAGVPSSSGPLLRVIVWLSLWLRGANDRRKLNPA